MNFIRKLLVGEPELSDTDRQFLRQFLALKPRLDEVVDSVDDAIRRGGTQDKIQVLQAAVSELPGLISKWDAIQLPVDSRRREAAQLFGDALRVQVDAYARFLKWYETGDDSIGEQAAALINHAGELMQRSSKKSGYW